MRKFLIRIALFSTVIVALLTTGELIVRNLPNSYSYKDWFINNHGDEVSTLILGSSHTYYGLRSDFCGDSVFNLANVSQTPDIDFELLKHYRSKLRNLRRIIVPVSYFTFADPKLEDSDGWFRGIGYKVSMKLPIYSDLSRYNFEIADFDGYAAKLRGLVLNVPSNKCDSLGWGMGFTLSDRRPDWEAQGKIRAESTTIKLTQRADDVEKILETIIKYCKARSIECIFVTTPVWPTYIDNLDPIQLSDMRRRLSRLVSRYRLEYFDMFSDSDFVAEDFHDVDHLSDVGATRLSAKLRQLLEGRSGTSSGI